MAENHIKESETSFDNWKEIAHTRVGYIEGFKAYQELVKDKFVLSKEQLEDVLFDILSKKQSECCVTNTKDSIVREAIQLLLPKTEWDITIDEQGKLKLL